MDTFPTGSSSRCWQWSQQTQKDIFFAASFIFVLPRCWRWWWETTWKTPSCSRWSIHHITCTCRFFVWKLKKATTAKNEGLALSLSNLTCLPFFRLWTRQFSSTTRTTPARSTSRSFARSIFFGCTNLKYLCRWLETRIFTRRWLWKCELAPSCQRIDAKRSKALRKNGNSRTKCLVNLK